MPACGAIAIAVPVLITGTLILPFSLANSGNATALLHLLSNRETDMLQIPGYRIVRTLAEGGMATVYLAVQESLGREVALKVMSPALSGIRHGHGERFLHEARILAKLEHPHIVTVHDVGVHHGLYYLAMAYVQGEDLLRQRDQLSLQQSVTALQQIALALDFAHQKGYVHGDIKPENILLDHGRALLADFGIARLAGDGGAIGGGTPAYMSPEQAAGQALDHHADLYSLGVVLFWLVCGRLPFPLDATIPVDVLHATEPIPCLPAEVIPFQAIIDRAMAKLPAARFGSGAEFAEALAEVQKQININMETDWRDLISRTTGPSLDDAIFGTFSASSFTFHHTPAPAEMPLVGQRPWVTAPALATRFQLRPRDRRFPAPPSRGSFLGRLTAATLVLVVTTVTLAWVWQQQAALQGSRPVDGRLDDTRIAMAANRAGPRGSASSNASISSSSTSDAASSTNMTGTGADNAVAPLAVPPQRRNQAPEPAITQLSPEQPTTDSALRYAQDSAFEPQAAPAVAEKSGDFAAIEHENALIERHLEQNTEVRNDHSDAPFAEPVALTESSTTEQTVAEQLNLAAAAVKAGRLTSPADQSAVHLYQQVLQLDPDNPVARTGLLQIATTLTQRSADRLDRGDPAAAKVLLREAAALNPNNREVQRLQERLAARQRAESAGPLLSKAQRAHARGALIAPVDDNAFDLYHQVLRRDWNSHLALRGLAEVEVQLADEIERLWRQGQPTEAQTLYRQALQRYPGSRDLEDAGRNIGVRQQVERNR